MALNRIPDSMLPNFTCINCRKYVTNIPIAIEEDGKISCGNCTDWTKPKVRCNLLESLAMLYAFPCKNRPAGCSKYLCFNNTNEHESQCEYFTFACPYSLINHDCNWEGGITNLLHHYRRQHPTFATNYPTFKITIDDDYEKYYIIEIDNIVLILQIKFSVVEGKLWFNTVYIGQPQNAQFIQYRINLSCKDVSKHSINLASKTAVGLDHTKMELDKCADITKARVLECLPGAPWLHCAWNVYVFTTFDDVVKIEEEDANPNLIEAKTRDTSCPNCNVLMVPPIYRCHQPLKLHVTCTNCKGYYNECKQCQQNDVLFTRADDLEKISELKLYTCRWANCKTVMTFLNIRPHEQQCTHRIFTCPKCNIWSGEASALFAHFKSVHNQVKISQMNPLFINHGRFVPGYLFVYNELFLVGVDVDQRRRVTTCSVTYLGAPAQFTDWEFTLMTKNDRVIPQHSKEANVIVFKSQPAFILRYKFSISKTCLKTDN